jgi:hypothetical protein
MTSSVINSDSEMILIYIINILVCLVCCLFIQCIINVSKRCRASLAIYRLKLRAKHLAVESYRRHELMKEFKPDIPIYVKQEDF